MVTVTVINGLVTLLRNVATNEKVPATRVELAAVTTNVPLPPSRSDENWPRLLSTHWASALFGLPGAKE